PTTKETTLGDLRSNFRDAALDIAALPSPRTRSEDPDIRWFEETLARIPADAVPHAIHLDDVQVDPLIQNYLDKEGSNDLVSVGVDRFDWPQDYTFEEVDKAYRDLLRKQAIQDTADKVKNLRSNPDITPDEAITGIEDAHSIGGSIGSGTVDFAGMDAGRDAILSAIKGDRLVLAVARGTGPDPCAFCSMLASRGFVFKSELTAGVGEEDVIKKYHVHCHCFPIYKFVKVSELPPLSQYFKEQWPIVTAGYSGLDARKAWRRWIYAQRKANPGAPHGALSTVN
ncbi:MAG: VG15 protein, partial [Arthrobacter sp.]